MNIKRPNKKRNAALLYEFLIRHISKCLIEGKKDDAKKALSLSQQYFSKGTCINEEMALYRTIFSVKVSSRDSAKRIIESVCNSSSKINARKLDEEKSKLIREINYSFNADGNFYNHTLLPSK